MRYSSTEGFGEYYFCGENFNLADVILTVTLEKLRFLGLARHIFKDGFHPHVALYYHRVRQRPSVQTVCVEGLASGTLIRTMLYFKLQGLVKPLVVIGAVSAVSYLLWDYYKVKH